MPSGPHVRASVCHDMTGTPRPYAPDLLRPDASVRASSPRPGSARPRDAPGTALDATASRVPQALPPGRRVVALREAEGMTHHVLPILPEVCRPARAQALAFKEAWTRVGTAAGLVRHRRPLTHVRTPVTLAPNLCATSGFNQEQHDRTTYCRHSTPHHRLVLLTQVGCHVVVAYRCG